MEQSPSTPSEKAVLICLALHSGDGELTISVETLSRRTLYCQATVRAALSRLVADGYLTRTRKGLGYKRGVSAYSYFFPAEVEAA